MSCGGEKTSSGYFLVRWTVLGPVLAPWDFLGGGGVYLFDFIRTSPSQIYLSKPPSLPLSLGFSFFKGTIPECVFQSLGPSIRIPFYGQSKF